MNSIFSSNKIVKLKSDILIKFFQVRSSSLKGMDTSRRLQPLWNLPINSISDTLPPLKLFNSLTSQKELFVPQNGRNVTWYGCGPTVYDVSHMGHARTYISFDIVRRVLDSYFGYQIKYVMNITDIDDKIIKRARQNHLYEKFLNDYKNRNADEVIKDINAAIEYLRNKMLKETDVDKQDMYKRDLSKADFVMSTHGDDLHLLIQSCGDPLSNYLDSKFGHTINDNTIFEKLPRHFEEEYFKDMDALNILRPDKLTRVSEFLPEIVQFVEKIIEKGFAYESNGSVYFDVNKFDSTEGHFYAKLMPTAVGDEVKLQEGEGDLSVGADRLREKRSVKDFALWKISKPGEPSWPSPWGNGRPGWHIECSVMASSILGDSMDIHSGGVDLKFPHHDNELAQSEAYFGNSHWVRYFLHSGHLTISGCKMSKSLKNFITIREVLQNHSSRRLRLAFLLHSWKDTLDYSEDTMSEAIIYEKLLLDFFFNVKYYIRHSTDASLDDMDCENIAIGEKVKDCRSVVHNALLDSIDTRSALLALQNLIADCNSYVKRCQSSGKSVHWKHLQDAAQFVSHIMRVFGAAKSNVSSDYIGFEPIDFTFADELKNLTHKFMNEVRVNGGQCFLDVCNEINENLVPKLDEQVTEKKGTALIDMLETVAKIRANVRAVARNHKLTNVLKLCDDFRDDHLPEIGIRLEDRGEDCPVAIDLVDAQALREERIQRLAKENEKLLQKEKLRCDQAKLAKEKDVKNSVRPQDLFRNEPDKYSNFDDRGLPMCDANGKELSKGLLKKLTKLLEQQEKKYAEWLKRTASS